MQASNLVAVVSRYVAGSLILVTIGFEFASLPFTFFVFAIGESAIVAISPFIVIVILVFVWLRVEKHRQFYPHAAFLLGLGWMTFLIVAKKWSVFVFISSYAFWHMMLVHWLMRLFHSLIMLFH
jgi:hypothetical protein